LENHKIGLKFFKNLEKAGLILFALGKRWHVCKRKFKKFALLGLGEWASATTRGQ
jgi:hypothetical protein